VNLWVTLSFMRRQVDLYLSCSLTGGRQDQPVVAALVARMEALGHRVLTAHLAAESAMTADGGLSPEAVFERDTAWLRDSNAVIAEVSTPSHGVGFEIAYALERGKPVLCLAREGVRVSKMLTGVRQTGFHFQTYRTVEEALAHQEAFLARY
jgi:nucleoside 2-deoxyribosyltransferase